MLFGDTLAWANNGFVSMFQRIQYENYVEKEKERLAELEAKRLKIENERKAEELKRRELERKKLEEQVVKFEDFKESEPVESRDASMDDFFDGMNGDSSETTDKVVSLPTYSLQGVVLGPEGDQAIIDGKVYAIGDKISAESELLAVHQDRVVIRYLTQSMTVMIPMMSVTTGDLDEDSGDFINTLDEEGFDDFFEGNDAGESVMNLTVHEE